MNQLFIGVMSGTSLDGVDVTLCEINDSSCSLLHALEYPFDKALKEEILTLIHASTTLEQIGILNTKLGILFSDSINALLTQNSIDTTTVTAIGLHGQTLWHQPKGDFPFSMQLGCPNIVVERTGIQVVADFRSMDIANGGQGAPFAPAFHQEIFASLQQKTAILNIGGMANITLLGDELKGWDTGVGNALLDYWIQTSKGLTYDKDGEFAKSGKVHNDLLENMLNDPYFKLPPPKSTGREYFNATWITTLLPTFATIKDEDIQRTLLELTALSITKEIQNTDVQTVIVCGGGAKNIFLMQRLQELNTCDIQTSEKFGVSSDYMESMAFAWLAYKRIHRSEVNLSSVTGARKNSILGGIYG